MKSLICLLFFLVMGHLSVAQTQNITIDDTGRSYSLYIPKEQANDSIGRAICFLDPTANGSTPVELYQSLADKYGLILAGSNNSKNGHLDNILSEARLMIGDMQKRFSLSTDSIIISGFSGGARSAVYYALNSEIGGVIGCGSGLPFGFKYHTYIPYVGLIGVQDMNYLEMLDLENSYNNETVTILPFNGGHQWPPVESYEMALMWQLNQSSSKYDDLLNRRHSQIIDSLETDSELVLAAQWAKRSGFSSKYEEITATRDYQKESKSYEKIIADERELTEEIITSLEAIKSSVYYESSSKKDMDWWVQLSFDIERKIKKGVTRNSGLRLRGFVNANCYERAIVLLANKHLAQAAELYQIMALFAANEIIKYYYELRVSLINKDSSKIKAAIKSLKNAGYNLDRLLNDPFMQSYGIKTIINDLK